MEYQSKDGYGQPVATENKLTDWKVEPTLEQLKCDYDAVQSFHAAHIAKLNTWDDNYHAKGSAAIKHDAANRSKVVPRLIRKHAEWRYAALSEPLLSTQSLFEVSPVTWEDRKASQQNALILNNQFDTKIDKTAFIDEYVRELVDCGTAVLRVSWVFEEAEVMKPVYQYEYVADPSLAEQLQQTMQLEQTNPSEFMSLPPDVLESIRMSKENNQPIRASIVSQTEELQVEIIRNHPMVEVCDLRNVYIDPTCMGDIDKAGFVIYAYETSMSDLKKANKYKNLDKIVMASANPLSQPDSTVTGTTVNSFQFKDEPRRKMIAYEYWGFRDIDGSGITVPIVATWVGNTLIGLTENPYPDKKLPFILVKYLPTRKAVYGEPDGELLLENQKILGAVTRGMIDLMGQTANGQTGTAKGLLDATNFSRMRSGQNYEYNPNFDPRSHIYSHKYPEIPQSAAYMLQLMNSDAESLTGIKAFGGGGLTANALGASSSSSAAVRGVLDAASKREMSILRRLVMGLTKIGRKFISMNAEFLSDAERVRITNDSFVVVKRDELSGNFDLKINVATPEAENAKAQELAFMLQTMGNAMNPDMSKLLLGEIARLRKMPDLAHLIEGFEPKPDPLAEEERKAEVEMKMAQAALYRAQAEESMAKSQLNSAKVPVEQARTENLMSKADSTRLDAANKDSGVTHEREIQKQMFTQQGKQELANSSHNSNIKQKLLDNELNSFNPMRGM